MAREALLLRPDDDVAIALAPLTAGHETELGGADGRRLLVHDEIPLGHKVAVRHIAAGETVSKLGHAIGIATRPISVGEHVHVHNLASQRGTSRAG